MVKLMVRKITQMVFENMRQVNPHILFGSVGRLAVARGRIE